LIAKGSFAVEIEFLDDSGGVLAAAFTFFSGKIST
jgi:hypothetical protein